MVLSTDRRVPRRSTRRYNEEVGRLLAGNWRVLAQLTRTDYRKMDDRALLRALRLMLQDRKAGFDQLAPHRCSVGVGCANICWYCCNRRFGVAFRGVYLSRSEPLNLDILATQAAWNSVAILLQKSPSLGRFSVHFPASGRTLAAGRVEAGTPDKPLEARDLAGIRGLGAISVARCSALRGTTWDFVRSEAGIADRGVGHSVAHSVARAGTELRVSPLIGVRYERP